MSSAAQKPRVRFAPSPTGFLHVGGARTALYNWLFARHLGGKFILRIEDTDRSRSTDEAAAQIIDSMKWLGLDWDEGPVHQSQRLDLYRKGVQRLIEKGAAFESDEERGRCVRFRVPDSGQITMDDSVHGEVAFDVSLIEDFVILRADGFPTYNYACVIDDADMGITIVMRGDDHISNTPKQIMLMNALGHVIPKFCHLPQVLGPDMKKLSKRHGAASVMEYQRMGFFPQAVVNFLAFLSWNPGDDREKMEMDELIKAFSIENINKKSGVFDLQKLEWLNGQYLNDLPEEEILAVAAPLFVEAGYIASDEVESRREYLLTIITHLKERCRLITELPGMAGYFFNDPNTYEEKGVRKHFKTIDVAERLEGLAERFESLGEFTIEGAEEATREYADEMEVGAGKLIHPTRLSVSGVTFGPGLFDILTMVGRDKTVARMRAGAAFIRARGEE